MPIESKTTLKDDFENVEDALREVPSRGLYAADYGDALERIRLDHQRLYEALGQIVGIGDREGRKCHRRGYAAFINGKGLKDCPMENDEEKSAWVRGFNLSASTPHGVLL